MAFSEDKVLKKKKKFAWRVTPNVFFLPLVFRITAARHLLLAMIAHEVGQSPAGQDRIPEGRPVPGARQRHARGLGQQRQGVLRVLHEREVALGLRHGRRPLPVPEADCRR